MKRILASVFLLAMSSVLLYSEARHYFFRHYMIEDGLNINTVYSTTTDHLGYMWFGTRDGLCRYDGTSFERVYDETGFANGMVSSLCEDSEGFLWFSTMNGVGRYNLQTNTFEKIDLWEVMRVNDVVDDNNGSVWVVAQNALFRFFSSENRIFNIGEKTNYSFLHACKDRKGDVWFTTNDGKLLRYDNVSGNFIALDFELEKSGDASDVWPEHISAIDDTYLLVSTNTSEIYRVNMHTGKGARLFVSEYPVNCLMASDPNRFWIGTFGGVYIYDARTEDISLYGDWAESGLSSNNVTCLSSDKEGNVWLGTYYGGVNFYSNPDNAIERILHTGVEPDFGGRVVHAFETDGDSILWVGTEDGHLNRLNYNRKTLVEIPLEDQLNIHSLLSDRNLLWVLTFENGILTYDKTSGKWSRREDSPLGNCICMIRLIDGSILFGTSTGLYRYGPTDDIIAKVPDTGYFIHSLYQDSRGTVWVGTFGNGLLFSKDNLQTLSPVSGAQGADAPFSGYINHITEDAYHHLWVCTQGDGICWTSLDSPLEFSYITMEQGLPSNIACALVEDSEHGSLWVSTTNGLALIDSKSNTVSKSYLDNGRLNGNQYTNGSCCKLAGGRICFGTTNGFISFLPSAIHDPISNAPLYFRRIYAEGERGSKLLAEEGKSVTETREIVLKKRDASHLSITFPAVYFSNLSTPKYEYTLSKRGKVFTHNVTEVPMVAFTDLRAGSYLLDVHLINSTNPQARQQLSIRIVPPLYTSALAFLFYFLFLLSGIVTFLYSLFRRRKIQEEYEREQMESFRQKELVDSKLHFFTNITHEIRTPLSLIKLPIDKIIDNKEYTPQSKEDIMTIKANTDRLLELVNQLLDIRKMERGEVTVQYVKKDICQIVRKTCDYFLPALGEQHLKMTVNLPSEPVIMKCAPDLIQKIISNLMSNAVKFSRETIEVDLHTSADGKFMELSVRSDGDKIKLRDREKIFTPFYQVENSSERNKWYGGTGLGLPYSRTLASLHNGTLVLDDSVTDGNCFVLSIPMEITEKEPEVEIEEEVGEETDSSKRTLLVVEDDEQMRKYLCKELSAVYNIFSANNGEKAIRLLNEHRIDLVVSDVMMPVMDGCELCNYIKSNNDFSHVPVLLLTAAIGVETRINTLESGADGFIEKPFNMSLLLATIDNLFKNKEIAYRQFADSPLTHYNSTTPNKVENAFMEKLHSAIMEHLSDTDLDTTLLCDILGTSKATLYRKIKANTGLNTNEYVRLCRLKKAADMLASGKYRINEVAYLTGFTSPSYFATSFQKQFNISPSAFVKNLKK